MMIVLRIVAVLNNNEELARHIQVSSLANVCADISSFMNELEANEFHADEKTQVMKIMVQTQHLREGLCGKPLSVVNMCGKITHQATMHTHTPGVKAYIRKERNNFGVSYAVYTRFCNFHTGNNKTSTLFRAGTSSRAIGHGISHVFVLDNLLDVVVTNIVYNARVGRPVCANNERIMRAFKKLGMGPVLSCMPLEECMFVHCLKQELKDPATLQSIGLEGMHDVSVRANICRTGVVNFFFGLPGGVNLSSDPELRVISVCETLLQAIISAT
jgi:hypothetical protein